MGKKKEKENLAEGLAEAFERWEYLKEYGGSDPFYADGINMNLERNHIMYYKNKIVEEYGADYIRQVMMNIQVDIGNSGLTEKILEKKTGWLMWLFQELDIYWHLEYQSLRIFQKEIEKY